MRIERVKLSNFRNLDEISVAVSPRINILLGRNGQGKTNFLEGLSYLALGKSWRGGRDRELIRFEEDFCHISVEGRDEHGDEFELEAALSRDGKKRIKIDGQLIERQADLVGHLSVVRFDPDEVELAKGSPDHRRRFLDYTLSLGTSDYFRSLLDYRRVVAQKNRLLRSRARGLDAQLDAWDVELIETGAPLLGARREVMGDLERHTREAYEELAPAGGRLSLRLDSTVVTTEGTSQEEIKETFAQTLHAARARELQMGHSLVGPHRDRLEVHLRGRSLRRYGSQGEKRSASIALKLAQGEWLFEHTRERPAVLLDDIFSELDRTRTHALQRRLHREHQLFIATARIDDVIGMRGWDGLKAWSVQDGLLEEIDILDDAVLDAQREALATRNGEA